MLEETRESLTRVQKFNVDSLPRREELGAKFAFEDAVEPAKKLIELFKKLPSVALDEYPDAQLTIIKTQADQIFKQFDDIKTFDETTADATTRKSTLIKNISNSHDNVFKNLFPLISYAVARTVDFNKLEEQGRAAVQSISDRTDTVVKGLEEAQNKAEIAINEIKTAAAEQGVSQQAAYFKIEADTENQNAEIWKNNTLWWALGLGVFGVSSLFLHKIPYFSPNNLSEGITLTASKLVMFAVLIYMMALSAKNFLSHKHNATVNRHRQNGLQTFQVLVSAGTTGATQDIILSHAAASIFAPQETGYTKQSSNQSHNTTGMIEMAVRATNKNDSGI